MVDPITIGSYFVVLFAITPVIILCVFQNGLFSMPKETPAFQAPNPGSLTSEGKTKSVAIGHDSIHQNASNPEVILAEAYNDQAISEISRCSASGFNATLCQDTISLLVKSCGNDETHVPACDDPRLAPFKAQSQVQ